MSEEKYVLTRSELLQLIIDQEKLGALEASGVDNWQWYGEDGMFDEVSILEGYQDYECEKIADKQTSALQEHFLSKYTKHSNSDGYHTFDELYEHRNILFCLAANALNLLEHMKPFSVSKGVAFWSKKHCDGSMFEGYIVVGVFISGSWVTYHMKESYSKFLSSIPELDSAPEWDGHTSQDVIKRLSDFLVRQ